MKKAKQKTRVIVAMSGGGDSSVAALLAKRQGYEVIGGFMKNYSNARGTKKSEDILEECNWRQDRKEAMKIASRLGIPLITLDFEKEYRKLVVDEMFRLYRKGITPNPDVDCNQKIKFPLLRKAAKKLKADFIITGHYARIKRVGRKGVNKNSLKDGKRGKLGVAVGAGGGQQNINYRAHSGTPEEGSQYELLRAKDESKDQSYFLYRLSQEDLSHSLFPIGDYTKKQVRQIAKRNSFQNFDRKGTVGICFIGKINLKKFLQARISPKKGKILDPEGKQIGEHDGIYYYTIGQRLGPRFGIEVDKGKEKQLKKWYVARKSLRKNEITAAPEGHSFLLRKEIILKKPHWISAKPKSGKYHIRIRQVGELLPCSLSYDKKNGRFKILLKKPITGVSEGQAAVLYKGKTCLGGGVIGFN